MGKISTTQQILISMVAGTIFGCILYYANLSGPNGVGWINDHIVNGIFSLMGTVFIGSLKALVVPLVFCALFLGITSLADPSKLGSLGGKAIGIYLGTTAIAVTIALILASAIGPGIGMNLTPTQVQPTTEGMNVWTTLASYIPDNPLKMMVEGNMIPLIVFTVFFAMCYQKTTTSGKLTHVLEEVDGAFMAIISMIMSIAPYAVFAMLAKTMAGTGVDAIMNVGLYFFTVVLALIIHLTFTYNGLLVYGLAKLNPITFMKQVGDSMMFAFSTSSSAAATPINIKTAEENLGVSPSVASFTIPLGATINMDGTAIMQGVAAVFIAQAFGMDLTISQMAIIVVTAVAASVGTAAVPGVGLVMLAMVLSQVGIPVEGIALIVGVDRLLDMMRTAVNTTGDLAATVCIAKSENEINIDTFNTLR